MVQRAAGTPVARGVEPYAVLSKRVQRSLLATGEAETLGRGQHDPTPSSSFVEGQEIRDGVVITRKDVFEVSASA